MKTQSLEMDTPAAEKIQALRWWFWILFFATIAYMIWMRQVLLPLKTGEIVLFEMAKRKKEYAGKKVLKPMAHPSYFNTGCCCFNNGDISGIEISDGYIRLIKWEANENVSMRRVLEEAPLYYIFDQL